MAKSMDVTDSEAASGERRMVDSAEWMVSGPARARPHCTGANDGACDRKRVASTFDTIRRGHDGTAIGLGLPLGLSKAKPWAFACMLGCMNTSAKMRGPNKDQMGWHLPNRRERWCGMVPGLKRRADE